MRNFALVN